MINDTIDVLKQIYTLDDFRDIADYGCAKGTARNHIYYHETTAFFDRWENEIIEYLTDELSTDFLLHTFENAACDLTLYKNAIVWAFIEYVSFELVNEYNEEYALANLREVA